MLGHKCQQREHTYVEAPDSVRAGDDQGRTDEEEKNDDAGRINNSDVAHKSKPGSLG